VPRIVQIVCCCLAALAGARAEGTGVRAEMRTTLPAYDPAARQQAAAPPADGGTKPGDPPGPPRPAPPPAPGAGTDEKPVQLAPVQVLVERVKPAPPALLPRPFVQPAPNPVVVDPFLTPEARERQLVNKHLTALDRLVLNRWTIPLVAQTNTSRAKQAEQAQQNAAAQGELADAIDLLGQLDPNSKDYQELREIYLRIDYSRPRN